MDCGAVEVSPSTKLVVNTYMHAHIHARTHACTHAVHTYARAHARTPLNICAFSHTLVHLHSPFDALDSVCFFFGALRSCFFFDFCSMDTISWSLSSPIPAPDDLFT